MDTCSWKLQSLNPALRPQQTNMRLLMRKHPHSHHAWPLVHRRFKRQRVGDFQIRTLTAIQ